MMFQSLHEELIRQQESFNSLAERAQTLMQSSTDAHVSTQLTQMGSRYHSLITTSKVNIDLSVLLYKYLPNEKFLFLSLLMQELIRAVKMVESLQ